MWKKFIKRLFNKANNKNDCSKQTNKENKLDIQSDSYKHRGISANEANIFQPFLQSADFSISNYKNKHTNLKFKIALFSTLIDEQVVHSGVLPHMLDKEFRKIDDLKSIIPVGKIEITTDPKNIEEKLLTGYLVVSLENEPHVFATIDVSKELTRELMAPEVESNVLGPKEAFVESLNKNIHLVRKRLPVKQLKIDEFMIGTLSKTKVAVLYLENIASEENVNTVKQRISEIEYDFITDSSFVNKFLSDSTYSIFPQLLTTERPDRTSAVLTEGKIVIIVDGAPNALIGPTNLTQFLISFEDYYLDWFTASFLRFIRLLSVAFSITISAIYVAIVTYHYQLVPSDLLNILVTSRREIPFPPILEALILEIMIEILREAGARLPTKIGETIGIVGGIVLGTASVEAGLTSNVLLILVAMGALASFTTPVYEMGNTIRILRFPFIIFAHLWGLIGIAFCATILMAHLLRLTSLGRPYLEPIYPIRVVDFKDTVIRLPLKFQSELPLYSEAKKKYRYSSKKAKERKDIDE